MKKIFLILCLLGICKISTAQPYLPLTAGQGEPLSGSLYLKTNGVLFTNNGSAGTTDVFGYFTNSGGSYYFGVDNSSGTSFSSIPYSFNFYVPTSRAIVFSQAGTSRYTIDASGNSTWSGAGYLLSNCLALIQLTGAAPGIL